MKSRWIKIAAVVLVLMMLLCCSACKNGTKNQPADSKTDNSGTAAEPDTTEEPEKKPDLPEIRFDGKEFRILSLNAESYTTELYITEEEAEKGTDVDSAVYARAAMIFETYGVDIVMAPQKARADIDQWMTVTSLSADLNETYHLVANHGRNTAKYVINGLTGDWNRLKWVDLEADWWSQGAREQWVLPSGSIYMMMGDISYGSVGQAIGMFFNKKILRDAEMDYPYQLVRDGKWTFEQFRTYVTDAADTLNGDGSGNLDSDSFGYVTGISRGPQNILNSTGYHWVTIEDGNYSLLKQDAGNVSDAFDKWFDFIYKSGCCILNLDSATPSGKMVKALSEGRAAFMDDRIAYSAELSKKGADFGVVPSPKYSEQTDGYHTFVNAAANTFCIPRKIAENTEEAEFASVILEVMAYSGSREILPTYYKTILTYQSQTDGDSVEMIGKIRDGLSYDLAYYYDLNKLCDIGATIAKKKGNTNFATEYQALITGANTALDKWLDME